MALTVHTKEVREALLDATDRLLVQKGYKKMTIDDLAAEVGIGKDSVYQHFSSKKEFELSHIDRIVGRSEGKLPKIAAENISAADRLQKMLPIRVMPSFNSV